MSVSDQRKSSKDRSAWLCYCQPWDQMRAKHLTKFTDRHLAFSRIEKSVPIVNCPQLLLCFGELYTWFTIVEFYSFQRFNVATTRAKALLIVVGDPNVLRRDYCWRNLIELCRDNNACVGVEVNNTKSAYRDLFNKFVSKLVKTNDLPFDIDFFFSNLFPLQQNAFICFYWGTFIGACLQIGCTRPSTWS